jgi:hypothetical protein
LSSVKNRITQFVKGETLFSEAAFKSWRIILFIMLLLVIMIRSGHQVDEKVLRIAKLKKQENELRAEYIALRSKTMKLKLESTLINKVAELGIHPSQEPATVIKISEQ